MQLQLAPPATTLAHIRSIAVIGLIATALLTISLVANSQGPANAPASAKIAVIDVTRVLSSTKIGKGATAKLKQMQEDRIAKARQMDAEIQKLENDLKTKKPDLAQDKVDEMNKQLTDKRAAMQTFAENAEEEVSQARNRELAAIDTKMKPVLESVAKEMGATAIFNKFESGLIWSADSIDITNTVIQRVDAATTTPAAP